MAQVGQWEFGRTLADLLADAHDGDAGTHESHAFDARILVTAQTADDATVFQAASAARGSAAAWLASDGATRPIELHRTHDAQAWGEAVARDPRALAHGIRAYEAQHEAALREAGTKVHDDIAILRAV